MNKEKLIVCAMTLIVGIALLWYCAYALVKFEYVLLVYEPRFPESAHRGVLDRGWIGIGLVDIIGICAICVAATLGTKEFWLRLRPGILWFILWQLVSAIQSKYLIIVLVADQLRNLVIIPSFEMIRERSGFCERVFFGSLLDGVERGYGGLFFSCIAGIWAFLLWAPWYVLGHTKLLKAFGIKQKRTAVGDL